MRLSKQHCQKENFIEEEQIEKNEFSGA